MMQKRLLLLTTILMTLAVWLVFSWPLPIKLSDGIPMSSTNIEKYGERSMMPGDHLQLHYFYWIFNDMLHGDTPFFHNLYEFNTGDDAARYHVGNYNVPFSFIYAFWALWGNSAFAWNMMGLTVIWITCLLTWILARRFTNSEWIAGLSALVGITVPYRWMNLFGGSPMGYAMTWVPLLLLGIDMVTRDRNIKGGIFAALALTGAFYNDTHIFFFAGLFMPLWGLVGLLRSDLLREPNRKKWTGLILAGMPIVIAAGLLLIRGMGVKASKLSTSMVSEGRAPAEVAIFTAPAEGLFKWHGFGMEAHIYLGWLIPAIITIGILAGGYILIAKRRTSQATAMGVISILTLNAVVITILAIGFNGPFDGKLFSLLRDHIPGYSMMRQPGKVFSLLPTVLAMLLATLFTMLHEASRWKPKLMRSIITVLAAAILIEYACQVRITICSLDQKQGAYEAVRLDADKTDGEARAMVIPFWPGDSAWASIYQHYVSLYHIKMLNGYSPIVSKTYRDEIYSTFGRSNVGVLPDDLLDNLLKRNIRYILLHENAFPEQVSPFPVGFTIKRLLNHPRLTLLKHAEHVWSFRVEKTATQSPEQLSDWNTFFPSQEWEFEHGEGMGNPSPTRCDEDTASGGGSILLNRPLQSLTTRAFRAWHAPSSRIRIRARGHGILATQLADKPNGLEILTKVNSDAWAWFNIPLTELPERSLCTPVFKATDGHIELDVAQYVAGEWEPLNEGDIRSLPAGIFFHAGHLTEDTTGVHMRKDAEPDSMIFYGPKLPLPCGSYQLQMEYQSDATAGTHLGNLHITGRQLEATPTTVTAGEPASINFKQQLNLPFRFDFEYTRNADIIIKRVIIERLAAQ